MNTFKVGDSVELIEDYAFFKAGITGVVLGVDSIYAFGPPLVKVYIDATRTLECYASRLKLSEVHKFKQGDKVRYTGGSSWSFLDGKEGDVFTVHAAFTGPLSGIPAVRLREGLSANPTHSQLPYYFELVEEPQNRFCINGGQWCDSLEEAKAWVQEKGSPEGRYEIFEMVPRAIVTVKETVTRELIEA